MGRGPPHLALICTAGRGWLVPFTQRWRRLSSRQDHGPHPAGGLATCAGVAAGAVGHRRRAAAPARVGHRLLPGRPRLHHPGSGLAVHLLPGASHHRLLLWAQLSPHQHARRRRAGIWPGGAGARRPLPIPSAHLPLHLAPLVRRVQRGHRRPPLLSPAHSPNRGASAGTAHAHHDARRLVCLCHAHRVSDQPHGACARRLPIRRLCAPGWRAHNPRWFVHLAHRLGGARVAPLSRPAVAARVSGRLHLATLYGGGRLDE
mmetsp:Transcript_20775/g.67248  ORF Transcript_20775/g.67248 Transcript_20775/m.67248 type:complete len:260 (+) Transcript_20775:1999-2778(+)